MAELPIDQEAYLRDLGMRNALVERVTTFYHAYRALVTDPVTDIFVSEYVDDEGTRQYENLWLFWEKYVAEALSFVNQERSDLMTLVENVGWIGLTRREFDLHTATPASRFTVNI